MKKVLLITFSLLMMNTYSFAQQAAQPEKLFYACEIAAGQLTNVNEKLTNLIFTNDNNSAWLQYLVNDAAFDQNAKQEDVFALVFDQVAPGAVTDGAQILNLLLDPNLQDVVTAANIADLSAVKTIYVFQSTNSQNQNLSVITVLFLDDQGLLGSAVMVGNEAAACTAPEEPANAANIQ